MCGFIGYLRLPGGDQGNLDAQLPPMATLLAHRGPDDAGVFTSAQCAIAHRRLSIIDRTAAGHQPMSSGPITVATNAEIYNFRELAQAHGLNDSMRSRTDTEVLLRLIETQGVKTAIALIDGMYAFAAWDADHGTLHLARDPFGIKPLFVLEHNHVLWFSSEIKPLLLVDGFERKPSVEALHHFLSFDYIPGKFTAFDGIEEVRPGTLWSIHAQTGQISKYAHGQTSWETDPNISATEAIANSGALLKTAVKRQLVADVEVGVMLSGGLDSSAIAALTKAVRGDADFHTFSIGFSDPSFDESHHARVVAEHLGTRHHHIEVTAADIAARLPHYLGSIHEPYADGSAIPTAMLAAVAAEHVTVLLSGEGGDEVFTGYATHSAAVARRWYRTIPRWVRRGLVAPVVHQLPVSHSKLSFDFKAKRFTRGVELSPADAHFSWREVLSEEAKDGLLKRGAGNEKFGPSNLLFSEAWSACESDDPVHAMLHTDRSYHLPDDLMVKNDRMTMAHSIEARVPFCDRDLVAYLATVPTQHLMNGLRPKVLLRAAMKEHLPPSILRRKKMGLEMPYSAWMRGPLATLTTDILSRERIERTGLFKPAPVAAMLSAHREMAVDNGRALWGLLNCVLWHELFIQTDDFRTATAKRTAH